MPKASIEFNLPEEEVDFKSAMNGGSYKSCLWDIDQYCRNLIKYSDNISEQTKEKLNEIRQMIAEQNIE